METNSIQDIQQCIQHCQNTAQQLRNLANQEANQQIKKMLTEGAHHLDLCVVECDFSLKQLQDPVMA